MQEAGSKAIKYMVIVFGNELGSDELGWNLGIRVKILVFDVWFLGLVTYGWAYSRTEYVKTH